MKTSTFAVLSFVGLICLAASILWLPLPPGGNPMKEAAEPGSVPAAETSTATIPDKVSQTPDQVRTEPDVPSLITAPKSDSGLSTTPAAATDERPLSPLQFPNWPKPALALVMTGEQHGYFEPCGCTANQLGGMSRRASLVDRIESLGWDVRGIEAGGLSRRSGLQAQIKFETTLEALRELQYIALGLGPEELRLGPDYLLAQHLTDGDQPLKFLGANLVFFGTKDLGTPLPSAVVEHNGLKIGVTSVMSDTIRRDVIPDRTPDEAAGADLNCTDSAAALTEVLNGFDEDGVTFRVLISHATLEESRQLAKDFPSIDVIVAANGFGEGETKPELIGNVRILQLGEKGKAAGVVALYPDNPAEPLKYELVTLDGRHFGDSARMTELMQSYQDRLKDQSVVTATDPVNHQSGAGFVGADKCGECHTKAFEIWKNTPHAHAFESLDPSFKRKGHERLHGVARTFDPECLSCHVTGWDAEEYVRFQSGFLNQEFASTDDEKKLQQVLAGNQCENCHGPGSRHVELIEAGNTEAAAKEVRVTLDQADVTCRNCHDLDNSPNFEFDEYWEKVKHSGRD